jgi:hypothetical protein
MKTIKLDLTGFTKSEVKKLAKDHNYSISTAYRSYARGWMTVTTD